MGIKRSFLIIMTCFSVLLNCAAFAQDTAVPIIKNGEIPGWTVKETRYFGDKELYGYIDGGAEIYREYGFVRVAVQDLQNAAEEIQIEVYRMSDPQAAFGIFSISRHNCGSPVDLPGFICDTRYQLLVARGPFFMTFTNYSGDSTARSASVKIAGTLLARVKGGDTEIPDFFRRARWKKLLGNLVFIKGPLGVQNRLPQWMALLGDLNAFTLYLLPVQEGEDRMNVAEIYFKKDSQKQLFLNHLGLDPESSRPGKWMAIHAENNTREVFMKPDGGIILAEAAPQSQLLDDLVHSGGAN